MKHAAWLVMCIVEDPDQGDTVAVSVTTQRGAHLRTEAEDIADGYGERFARRDPLATFDGRYEIVWPASRGIAAFPAVTAIAGTLRARCDGVIFDATEGTLV